MHDLELAVTSMQARGHCVSKPMRFFGAHMYTLYGIIIDLHASFDNSLIK